MSICHHFAQKKQMDYNNRMDHDQLVFDLANAVSVKLLRTPHAPLLLSFLYREFKQSGRVTIPHSTLVETLDEYLETLRLDHPDRYPGAAALYLRQWCDEEHRFLRRYHEANSDDPVYELTADTERALGWVQELHRSEFVGTESRFLRIFDLLREIVEMSTVNAADRLAQLEAQKAAIQAQIDAIQASGQVQRSSSTQLKERFFDANDLARRLIADFREVEENFRAIARDVQKQQLQAGVSKGQIVGYVLDADIALKESDQGRSFYAFWQFLLSHSKQEELRVLLDKVYTLPDLPTAREDQQMVRQLKRRLIDAGSKIVDSNRRLAEQLRKLLDEQRLAEARRVQELIAEIKQAAIRLEQAWPEGADFTEIDGLPDVNLPMERQFWRPTIKTTFGETEIAIATADLEEANWAALFNQRHVDETRLRRNIDILLDQRPQVTLTEVLVTFPVQQGLAEVVTYLAIAAKNAQHTIEPTVREMVELRDETVVPTGIDGEQASRRITLPQIIFRAG